MQRFAAARISVMPDSARRVFDVIRREMSLVEDEFERQASSNIQVINYLGDHLRASGGKRVRPALFVLANYAVGGDGSSANAIRLATVMEMLHTATLVHDDIIDNAEIRRNRSTINARFGNQVAVLMGDWLYMSAYETAAAERSLEIIDILTRLTRKMTEGELIQLTRIGRLDISEDEYFDILRRKTAYLFSACCEVAALLGGATPAEREALSNYGLELGTAFQLADDLLDVSGEGETLGKAAGTDLLEGKLTLPLILLIERRPAMAEALERIMRDGVYGDPSRDELRRVLETEGIFTDIRGLARTHSAAARKSLELLPKSEYRSCLDDVLSFITDRSS